MLAQVNHYCHHKKSARSAIAERASRELKLRPLGTSALGRQGDERRLLRRAPVEKRLEHVAAPVPERDAEVILESARQYLFAKYRVELRYGLIFARLREPVNPAPSATLLVHGKGADQHPSARVGPLHQPANLVGRRDKKSILDLDTQAIEFYYRRIASHNLPPALLALSQMIGLAKTRSLVKAWHWPKNYQYRPIPNRPFKNQDQETKGVRQDPDFAYNIPMTQLAEIGDIEDVDKSTSDYINRRWGAKYYLPGIALAALAAAIAVYFQSYGYLFIPVVWFAGGWGLAQGKVRDEFMRQFAARNNFAYKGYGSLGEVEGALFRRGHGRRITHVVAGAEGEHPVRFYFFTYTVGSGKHKKTYNYTVGEVAFSGLLPDIIVEARGDWDFSDLASSHFKQIRLGGSFEDHFGVFVQDDLEIEAFEIFTPEVMEELAGRARDYNFEFINRKLYVFKKGYISKRAELADLLSLIQYLVEKVAPRIRRLHDDVAAMKSAKVSA
ncbi:MAG: hypothetical protein UY71_C0002G0007 [Parcubacteria group bacterium GW2011_GWB1_52_7]|nr:MAG: hypothetical protein UY71_C0002G0007 [Parcubacteria group bacterium GW2011_GWB1_52_7]KKW31696.1 MAG: hypothetical protein UY75_C0002G0009 [Parcubacteria group bacterium GW2011_GWC2_52_8c]